MSCTRTSSIHSVHTAERGIASSPVIFAGLAGFFGTVTGLRENVAAGSVGAAGVGIADGIGVAGFGTAVVAGRTGAAAFPPKEASACGDIAILPAGA